MLALAAERAVERILGIATAVLILLIFNVLFGHFRLAARLDREALWHFLGREAIAANRSRPASRHFPGIVRPCGRLPWIPHSESWHLIIKIGLKCRAATSSEGRAVQSAPSPLKDNHEPFLFFTDFETMYETTPQGKGQLWQN